MRVVSKIDFNGFSSLFTAWTWHCDHGTMLGHFKTRDQAHMAIKYAVKRITKKGRL